MCGLAQVPRRAASTSSCYSRTTRSRIADQLPALVLTPQDSVPGKALIRVHPQCQETVARLLRNATWDAES
jgi:hypothetical protein